MSSSESKLRDGLLFRRIVDEGLLLDLEADVGYRLNEVGMRILTLLSRGIDGERLVERLCAEFEIDPVECALEVEEFLVQLEAKKLLRSG